MVLGFGVWVHHMFATGLPSLSLVVLQRRVDHHRRAQRGRGVRLDRHDLDWAGPVFTTPFLFFASFIVLFTIGGVSGFMTASRAGRSGSSPTPISSSRICTMC